MLRKEVPKHNRRGAKRIILILFFFSFFLSPTKNTLTYVRLFFCIKIPPIRSTTTRWSRGGRGFTFFPSPFLSSFNQHRYHPNFFLLSKKMPHTMTTTKRWTRGGRGITFFSSSFLLSTNNATVLTFSFLSSTKCHPPYRQPQDGRGEDGSGIDMAQPITVSNQFDAPFLYLLISFLGTSSSEPQAYWASWDGFLVIAQYHTGCWFPVRGRRRGLAG